MMAFALAAVMPLRAWSSYCVAWLILTAAQAKPLKDKHPTIVINRFFMVFSWLKRQELTALKQNGARRFTATGTALSSLKPRTPRREALQSRNQDNRILMPDR